ncbi:MAG: TIM barrel protein [Clostridia bacterium]|nr:TIM barrel protein [Clostridia bacterium]MBQ8720299.1 TIM barrel protein [Clostridia bacterium]
MKNYILSAFADEYSDALEEQLKALAGFGIPSLELRHADGKNVSEMTEEDITRVKNLADFYGISISAIGSPIGKVTLDGDIDGHFEMAERVFSYAKVLGAKRVRVFSFYPPEGKDIADCEDEVFALTERMLDLGDKYSLTLCHENEAKIYGDTPERCKKLLDRFGGRLKCVFDMGNFVLEGVDPLKAYDELSEYIEYFHIKDALAKGAIVPPGAGEAKIAEILARHSAEHGAVSLTLEPHLETFSGLNALVGRSFENPYKYESPKSAFTDAVEKLKDILKGESDMKSFVKDKLTVNIYDSRKAMGCAAAEDIKNAIVAALSKKDEINMIFAAAPSQNEVLAALAADPEIEWGRINAYHMDEYIGLAKDAPQGFGNFLRAHLFDLVPFKSVNCIKSDATDAVAECERYSKLLTENPTDIVVMGIGENGHIAFNDPPVADFADKCKAKPVKLDEICRNQQVNDGCFEKLSDVPTHAITLTVPALVAAPKLFCIVPAKTKAWAVKETLNGTIDEHCPASILRTHTDATLYLDPDSSSLLEA